MSINVQMELCNTSNVERENSCLCYGPRCCMLGHLEQCFLIGLLFLIGLEPIRTIRTINRLLIGLIVYIIVKHKAGLYKYISYIYGVYTIYYIFI